MFCFKLPKRKEIRNCIAPMHHLYYIDSVVFGGSNKIHLVSNVLKFHKNIISINIICINVFNCTAV